MLWGASLWHMFIVSSLSMKFYTVSETLTAILFLTLIVDSTNDKFIESRLILLNKVCKSTMVSVYYSITQELR